jgi:hypothetical protein
MRQPYFRASLIHFRSRERFKCPRCFLSWLSLPSEHGLRSCSAIRSSEISKGRSFCLTLGCLVRIRPARARVRIQQLEEKLLAPDRTATLAQ